MDPDFDVQERWKATVEGPEPLLSLRAAVANVLAYGASWVVHATLDQLSYQLREFGRGPQAAVVDEVLALMEGWGPEDLRLDAVEPLAR